MNYFSEILALKSNYCASSEINENLCTWIRKYKHEHRKTFC